MEKTRMEFNKPPVNTWTKTRRRVQNRIDLLTGEPSPRLIEPLRMIGAGDDTVMEYRDREGEVKRILWDERHYRDRH